MVQLGAPFPFMGGGDGGGGGGGLQRFRRQAWQLFRQKQLLYSLRFKSANAFLAQHGQRMALFSAGAMHMAAAGPPPPSIQPSGSPGAPGGPQPREKAFSDFGHPTRRGTDVMLVLNAACFVLQWLSKDALTYWGAKVNVLIAAGQWWRLITPTLLHSSVLHLAINSYALHSLGPHVELVGGHARFGAVYMTAALTGTLASYVMTPAPSLGSSGALFGLGAALALFYWRHREVLQQHSDAMLKNLGFTAVANLAYSVFINKNIDNWGHLGGMVGGALVAWALGPELIRDERGRFVDRPPIKWLAYPEGRAFSARGSSSSSSSGSISNGILGAQGGGREGSPAGGRGLGGEDGAEWQRRKLPPKKSKRKVQDEEEEAGGIGRGEA